MGYFKANCLLRWRLWGCIFASCELVCGQIRYSIPEELHEGAFVGNIAGDLGLKAAQLSERSFRIVSTARKPYLDANLDKGILFVKEKIDREDVCGPSLACVLSFEAVLENPFNLHDLEVEILDVNDNAPSFPKSQFRLEISEVVAPGSSFHLEGAHDPDVGTNALQTYELFANEYFTLKIEQRSGDGKLPVLVLEKPLDRELQSSHRLVLVAKDGGLPERSGTAEIVIVVQDANDNAPVFTQSVYSTSLSENALKGTLVMKLNATDLDDGTNGEIVYSFSSHTSSRVRQLFSLSSQSGEIRVKGDLDYEENRVFEINIKATDKGAYAITVYCRVLVNITDVNDNAPEVTLVSLFSPVREDSLPGTIVALINAADKDSGENGQVRCQVANELPFKLEPSSKKYLRLITQQPLDREKAPKFDITVLCSDRGTPALTSRKRIRLEVSDINDNAPRFTQPVYTAQVMENNVIGASIFSVSAVDPDFNQNARLIYSILENPIQGESVSSYFSINKENGIISSQRSLDYEQIKGFQIQVQARDNGEAPLASNASVDIIILDQNDNAPIIVSPIPEYGSMVTDTVSRLAEPGYLVVKVTANDADTGQNGHLTYQILQATEPGLFTISPDTGNIWTIRRMTNHDALKQRLVIVVKDNGSPSLSASVTIILSVEGGDTDTMVPDKSGLTAEPWLTTDISIYLVISLGITSSIFFVVLILLAIKIHNNRTGFRHSSDCLGMCYCFEARNSLNRIQRASRNIQIPPNYVEVFGGDPLSQSFRYGSYSTSGSTKTDLMFPNRCNSPTHRNSVRSGAIGKETPQVSSSAEYRNPVNGEVRCFKINITC